MREACPSTPIFLIYDDAAAPLATKELGALTVRDAFRKPISYADIEVAIQHGIKAFDPSATLAAHREETAEINVPFEGNDADFSPIRARSFLAAGVVFIRRSDCL